MELDNKSNYTFQDWIDGKEEPKMILDPNVATSIHYNQLVAFESALKIDLRLKKLLSIGEEFLDSLPVYDRNEFLSLEIQKTNKYFDSLEIDKQMIILNDSQTYGITAKQCQFIESGLNNRLGLDLTFLKENLIFQGRATYQYLKYLDSLIGKYKDNQPKEIKPFKDEQTKNLFEHIVKNWKNDTATKWGYIWNFLNDQESGGIAHKSDYETYLREKHNFTKGRPNYEVCGSDKRKNELAELKKEFLKI